MSFSLDTANFPRIATLDQAAVHWAKKKPWRSEPSNHRPLEKKTKKHCRLIRISDVEYRARLHDTDVVIYRPEGVTVNATYGSISTDKFIMALLRHAFFAVLGNRGYPVAWQTNRTGQNYWSHGQLINGNAAIFDLNGNLTNPKPYQRPTLDRKRSKGVRDKYNVDEFRAWRKAYQSMCPEARIHPERRGWYPENWRPDRLGAADIINMLMDRGDAWIDLAMECSDQHIIDCIYKCHPEIVRTEERATFENMAEYDNWLKLDSKYGWAIG